jgi:hypothetical protein
MSVKRPDYSRSSLRRRMELAIFLLIILSMMGLLVWLLFAANPPFLGPR